MDDKNLIKRCQDGQEEAFNQMILFYHPFVFKFLLKACRDKSLAEDLSQETFLKVIKNIDKFDVHKTPKFSTYIITIARNLYIDELRKTGNAAFLSLDEIDNNSILYQPQLQTNNVEKQVINNIIAEDIVNLIDKLPYEQQLAIKLKYLEDYTLKEIGEEMNEQAKTIKSRIHNGVQKIRNILNGGDY